MRSEAAPPAPLRGHFHFSAHSRTDEGYCRTRVPHGDLVTLDTCDEQSLIAAEASGLYQPTRCQLENVAMHRAGHALAVSIPFAQTRTRMIAGILYGAWNGVDKRNEYVERRMGEPNHVTRLKPRER